MYIYIETKTLNVGKKSNYIYVYMHIRNRICSINHPYGMFMNSEISTALNIVIRTLSMLVFFVFTYCFEFLV